MKEDRWDKENGLRRILKAHLIYRDTLHRMDDGTLRIYYTGQGADGKTAIGVARKKEDGSWEREQANLTFA